MNRPATPTRIPRLVLAALIGAGTLPVAGCNRSESPPEQVALADAPADSVSGPPPAEPVDAAARPDRIYYDLTRYDWYARGEPLVYEGISYEPEGGGPVALDARALEQIGEYGGVDVYRRASDARLYVPVYDGYWLAFEPGTPAAEPTGR